MTQEDAIKKMLSRTNVFLTGEPGAGKTYTLNKFIDQARNRGQRIAITASTGIAASHINGTTIHSWSGLGIKEELPPEELERLVYRKWIRDKYRNCDVLIIDEVSMLHGKRLNMIDRLARAARHNNVPFGGLQLIFVGDLFQLPPVTRGSDIIDYAHKSEAWGNANLQTCYLTEQHRQGAGDELLGILTRMRSGELTEADRQLLNSRIRHNNDDHITRLYTHNVDVDALNREKLVRLPGIAQRYSMIASGDKYKVDAMKRSILAPETLELKKDAEVMFVANNFTKGYVNGTRGRVIGFTKSNMPIVKTVDSKEITVTEHTWKTYDTYGRHVVAEVSQYPLRLAWAVTIHKSQGMSLDEALIDLTKTFTPGMGYVALSRVRSLKGLYLKGLNEQALDLDDEIAEFDKTLHKETIDKV